MSNMRQLGLGFVIYTDNWKGTVPHSNPAQIHYGLTATESQRLKNWSSGWAVQIYDYIENWEVFFCSSQTSFSDGFPYPEKGFDANNFSNPISAQGQNHGGISYHHSTSRVDGEMGLFYAYQTDNSVTPIKPNRPYFVKINEIHSPTNLLMVGDSADIPGGWWTNNSGLISWVGWQNEAWGWSYWEDLDLKQSYRHLEGSNLFFVDGHGNWYDRTDLEYTQREYDGGPGNNPQSSGKDWPFAW